MTEGELENLGLSGDGGGTSFGEELADLSAPADGRGDADRSE